MQRRFLLKYLCVLRLHIETLEQVTQRGSQVSILGDAQNPAGHSPGKNLFGARGEVPSKLSDSGKYWCLT